MSSQCRMPSARRVGGVGVRRLSRPNATGTQAELQAWPGNMEDAITVMQKSTQAAIDDGKRLLEVEFPSAGLFSVSGDADGCNEMTYSLEYLRKYLRMFQVSAENTRVFFPDKAEMQIAMEGQEQKRSAGARQIDALFEQTKFKLDYLTEPTGLMDFGIDLNKFSIADRVDASDSAFVIAYPHFNVNEILAVEELWTKTVQKAGQPVVVFNGELDRLRSNYYPALFYPKITKCGKEFIPQFETAFYIHNFKGSRWGVLFRAYPGPWQVGTVDKDDNVTWVHSQETRPTLRQVALDILPKYY